MLRNAYLLAKIGDDTAENERNSAKKLQLPYGSTNLRGGARGARALFAAGDAGAARRRPRGEQGRRRGVPRLPTFGHFWQDNEDMATFREILRRLDYGAVQKGVNLPKSRKGLEL